MEGYSWYLEDILIYGSDTEVDYQAIVEKVLLQYIEYGLAVKLLKREFHVKEIVCLVHIIYGQEVKMDPSKHENMFKWPIPVEQKKVPAFLVIAKYYCQVIVNYSAKARPLIDLTKDVPFTCGHTQQQAFHELRA